LPLVEALRVVEDTKRLIRELDAQIPEGQEASFHKRLVKYVNQLQRATTHTEAENTFRLRAGVLLVSFARRFGVNDLFDKPEQEMSAQG
jgi:hypothetical protein